MAILPKLDMSLVQTSPAAGTAVLAGQIVTYTLTITNDPSATDGAKNGVVTVDLGAGLTYSGGASVTDTNGFTDPVTTSGNGFQVNIGGVLNGTTQPVTVTFTGTVSVTATSVNPTANVVFQTASADKIVYGTNNITPQLYQYDATTGTLSSFGNPINNMDSLIFAADGNIYFTSQGSTNGQTGLTRYNVSNGSNVVVGNTGATGDLAVSPDGTTIIYNGLNGSAKALYSYNVTTGINSLLTNDPAGLTFNGLTFDPSGKLFATANPNGGFYSGANGYVVQLDPTNGAVLAQSTVIGTVDGITYDAYTQDLFVSGNSSPNLFQIDPSSFAVLHNWSLPSPLGLDGIASDGLGNLFIASYHQSIVKLDLTATDPAHVAQGSGAATAVASTPQIDDTVPAPAAPKFSVSASTSTSVYQPASLSGNVFLDQNANGVKEAGDTNIGSATVNLLDHNGLQIGTTNTDSSGNYSFTNLAPGTYSVQVVAPAGDTFDPVKGASLTLADSITDGVGKTTQVTLVSAENLGGQNSGLYQVGSLAGTVFQDGNNDGIDNHTDAGSSGETVQLLNAAGTVVLQTTLTDVNGNYIFNGLAPADYEVKVVAKYLEIISTPQFSASPNILSQDNNLADQTGLIAGGPSNIVVLSGQNVVHQDAGVTPAPTGSVSGFVFFDGNCNGIYHVGDAGVAGVTVNLKNGLGNVVQTTTSDAFGDYKFGIVQVGNYNVQVLAPQGTEFSDIEHASGNPAMNSDVNNAGVSDTLTVVVNQNTTGANAGLEFNGNFAGVTPINLADGQAYASLLGGQVVTGPGNNVVITGGPGESVVALDGNGNAIELGVDATGTAEQIGTSCGTLNAQTLRSSNGYLFAGGTGSSGLDGGPGYSYLMAGTGANQVYSGTGTNVIIAGGNGSALTVGGLSTTIYYQKGDGALYVEGGLRAVDSLTVYGYGSGNLVSIGGMAELQLGGGDVIYFVGATSLTTGVTSGQTGLNFDANILDKPFEELSFVNGLPVFTASGTPAAPAVPTPPAPPAPPSPPPAPPPAPATSITETVSGSDVVVGSTLNSLTLFGYDNTVTGASALGVTITGDQGSSSITLGGGNNVLELNGYGDHIVLGNGHNTVSGTAGNTTISVGSGDNAITLSGYTNTITTGGGANTIIAGAGQDNVHSGASTDDVTLAGWHNIVTVGVGSDSVVGGFGNTYVLTDIHGSFGVADFSLANSDVLDLTAVTTVAANVLITAVSANETDVSVISGAQTYLVADLHGVSAASLSIGHGITI